MPGNVSHIVVAFNPPWIVTTQPTVSVTQTSTGAVLA